MASGLRSVMAAISRHRESFDGVQDKNFAVAGRGGWQSKLHQRIHLVGGSDVFRRGHAAVGDYAFLGESFVRLMELELGFVAGANVRDTRPSLRGGPTTTLSELRTSRSPMA